jgi:hypothetical protein
VLLDTQITIVAGQRLGGTAEGTVGFQNSGTRLISSFHAAGS